MNETICLGARTYVRAEITLTKQQEVLDFIKAIGTAHLSVENEGGTNRVSAASVLGMLYAAAEFGRMFVVNEDNPGIIPSCIDAFRTLNLA